MNFLVENINDLTNFTSCKDVNRSGIGRFGFSPLISAANIFYVRKNIRSVINFLPHTEKIENYLIACSVNHSPDDWTGYDPKVKSLFSYLNEKYLIDLRNRKALLVLDQSFEGYQTPWLWEWFHKECREYNISPECIVYVTGNMIVEDIYKKWADDNNVTERLCTIGYPHFELDIAMNCFGKSFNENPLPTFQEHLDYKSTHNIKTFSCLNKRIRPHRVWFYNYLFHSGLLDKGLVSMNEFQKHGYTWEGKTMEMDTIDRISEKLPLRVYDKPNDELDDNFYITRFNPEICLDTYVSVVSEAHCGDGDETMFLSEKIFKPIATRHPFMVMGNKDSLKKMREIGYRTFDEYIDQSYDGLPTHERLHKLIESIRTIDNIENKLEWFKSMENDVEHNYNLLIDKITTSPPEAFVKLQKYHNNFFKIFI